MLAQFADTRRVAATQIPGASVRAGHYLNEARFVRQ